MYNPYINAFSNYNSPYINNPAAADRGFSQPYKQEITEVYGMQGAQAYQMAANSSVILLDASNPMVYIKRTDGAGSPSIAVYKLVQCQADESTSELEKRVRKLEEIINESYTVNASEFRRKSAESDSVD